MSDTENKALGELSTADLRAELARRAVKPPTMEEIRQMTDEEAQAAWEAEVQRRQEQAAQQQLASGDASGAATGDGSRSPARLHDDDVGPATGVDRLANAYAEAAKGGGEQ